jgi:hypothetical protein
MLEPGEETAKNGTIRRRLWTMTSIELMAIIGWFKKTACANKRMHLYPQLVSEISSKQHGM